MIDIPVDMYQSPDEIYIFMPLGGVNKTSVSISLQDNELIVRGNRELPQIKGSLIPTKQQCYWGDFEARVPLPPHVLYHKIHSELSKENILTIIVPKNIQPSELTVRVL